MLSWFYWVQKNSTDMTYTQFRLGILLLRIETGRFINGKVQNRVCNFCEDAVEDEKHFFFIVNYLKNKEKSY